MAKARRERDSLGEIDVPAERLWGAQTQRSIENFPIGRPRFVWNRAVIRALGIVKKASAETNRALGELPEDKAALKLIVSRQSIARPFAAPPGVPADRVAALRTAFDATMKDPDFLAETKKLALEVRPVSGSAVEQLIKDVYASPPEVVKLAAQAEK